MTTVEKLSTWVPVTEEWLADAPEFSRMLHAWMEYQGSEALHAPLTAKERITGIRVFVASNGYELHARVGWREVMYRALEAIRRERYPDDYRDEDDD